MSLESQHPNDGSSNTGTSDSGSGDKYEFKRRAKPGILRLDISRPSRRSSGGSVEFKNHPEFINDVSPSLSSAASPPQLSVKWASQCEINNQEPNLRSPMQNLLKISEEKKRSPEIRPNELSPDLSSSKKDSDEQNSDDEDYSQSVTAIMQRRVSIRAGSRRKSYKSSRRTSSPMDRILDAGYLGDRRRSSVYTTSSGETAISLDDGTNQDSTQEQIFENIRLHKEVIQSIKFQPWSIKRKLKLVRQAKTYVARHEGALQERFAISRSTKDLWARFKIVLAAKWRHWKREMASFGTVLIPWELRIKEIESHFGSGVASYFTFLRWLLWVNIMIAIPIVSFVIIPESLGTDKSIPDLRKNMTEAEAKIAGNIVTIWEFEGYLKYSPLFYGFYSSFSGAVRLGYNLPLAYFLTAILVYCFSFVATLRKMADNSRTSKLSLKDDECVFSWKLFTGWDFMIGHAETAHNRMASVVVSFKEALLEEAEKKKDKRNWRIIVQRVFVNILILGLLAASGYSVVLVVDRSETAKPYDTWFRKNEVNIIMNFLSFFLPMIFDVLGVFENWHPRKQLRLQLARIMILNLLNLYSLMFSFIYKITGKDSELQKIKLEYNALLNQTEEYQEKLNNISLAITTSTFSTTIIEENDYSLDNFTSLITSSIPDVASSIILPTLFTTPATMEIVNQTRCYSVPRNCSKSKNTTSTSLATTFLLLNLTTTMSPITTTTTTEITTTTTMKTTTPLITTTTIDLSTTTTTPETTTPYYEDETTSTAIPIYEDDPRANESEAYFVYYDYFDNLSPDNENNDLPKTRPKRDTNSINNQIQKNISGTVNESRMDDIDNTGETDYYINIDFNSMIPFTSTTVLENTMANETVTEYTTMSTMVAENVTIPFETLNRRQKDHNYMVKDKFQEYVNNVITLDNDSDDNNGLDNEDDCFEIICEEIYPTPSMNKSERTEIDILSENIRNNTRIITNIRRKLATMCWETSLGQELTKVIVMDTVVAIAAPMIIDFFRALFVRYINDHWCWDMEKTFPQYGDFKIAESILSLVYNQGQVWMGIFFSPGLVIINLIKLVVLMYLRSWIVLTCNVPHEVVFKASKSNNFYLSLLLCMLFLCVLPVGYAIVWLRPSWHCGPFSNYNRISEFFTNTTRDALPKTLHKPLEYMTSSSTVIPLLLLLILIIYYLVSLTGALREANQDLRTQLQKERAEERRKIFKLPEKQAADTTVAAITTRWRKVLEASSPVTPTGPQPLPDSEQIKSLARKELLARIMKKALRKDSDTSENDPFGNEDDETDHEAHEALPHDEEKKRHSRSGRNQPVKRARKPSIIDIVQLVKKESANESHPNNRFKVNQATTPKISESTDNDIDDHSRVVSERRRSLLRRHKQNEVDTDDAPANTFFDVVNEKSPHTEKKPEKPKKSEGGMFKFDLKALRIAAAKPMDGDTSPTDSVLSKKLNEKSDPASPTISEKVQSGKENLAAFSREGRKRIGSFLALVREAVNKKTDGTQSELPTPESSLPETPQSPSAPAIPQSFAQTPTTKSAHGQTSIITEKESDGRQQTTTTIPVITISKTTSDESILESGKEDKETAK